MRKGIEQPPPESRAHLSERQFLQLGRASALMRMRASTMKNGKEAMRRLKLAENTYKS